MLGKGKESNEETRLTALIADNAQVDNDIKYRQKWAGIEIVSNSGEEVQKLIDGLSKIPAQELQQLTHGA